MEQFPSSKRAEIVRCLLEGNSVLSTMRMTGTRYKAVFGVLTRVGEACSKYQDCVLRDLPCKRLQINEIWACMHAKGKKGTTARRAPEGAGDVWTWTAICADTKLVPSWLVGARDGEFASAFIDDLRQRLANPVVLTSDGHRAHLCVGNDAEQAALQQLYGSPPETDKRYSPVLCIDGKCKMLNGNPDAEHVSTSYVERQNLMMRMASRPLTVPMKKKSFTNKVVSYEAAIALHFMHHNFVRVQRSSRITPAMAAGVADRPWSVDDIALLVAPRTFHAPPRIDRPRINR